MNRISINPEVCHGKPCIKGTRVMVSLVLELLGAGYSAREILEDYPYLRREDILACLNYATNVINSSKSVVALTGGESK